MLIGDKTMTKILGVLFLVMPKLVLASGLPSGIFTYGYAVAVLQPFVIGNTFLSFYFWSKKKYIIKSFVFRHLWFGLIIFGTGVLLYCLDSPHSHADRSDVLCFYYAAFITAIAPLIIYLLQVKLKND